jgi:hypothetical protein
VYTDAPAQHLPKPQPCPLKEGETPGYAPAHPTGASSAESFNVRHVEVVHYLRSLSPGRVVARLQLQLTLLHFLMALSRDRSPWLARSRTASTR